LIHAPFGEKRLNQPLNGCAGDQQAFDRTDDDLITKLLQFATVPDRRGAAGEHVDQQRIPDFPGDLFEFGLALGASISSTSCDVSWRRSGWRARSDLVHRGPHRCSAPSKGSAEPSRGPIATAPLARMSCFIEAPQSQAELEQIPREVRYPLLVNMLTGGATPIRTVAELQQLGYKDRLCPIESLLVAGAAIQRLIQAFLTKARGSSGRQHDDVRRDQAAARMDEILACGASWRRISRSRHWPAAVWRGAVRRGGGETRRR